MAAPAPSTAVPTDGSEPAGSAAIAIAASAGGIAALIELLSVLPGGYPIPIFVAQHLAPFSPSILPEILGWRTELRVKWAEDGELPRGGTVYLAPPAHGMEVRESRLWIAPLPPGITSWLRCPDLMLRSVAQSYGARAVGIVLSGMLGAGISGLRAIRSHGGISMAQDEVSSPHFDMPRAAVDLGKADIVLPPSRMAEALLALAESWEASFGPRTGPAPAGDWPRRKADDGRRRRPR